MDIKNKVVMKVTCNDRDFELHMPYGCTIGQTYDGAFEILQQIVKIGQDTVAAVAQKEETNDAPKAS